jgi:hypothetical protein
MGVPRFEARWPGECAQCMGDIAEGDRAGYIDDEVCCESCCDEEG